MSRPIRCEHCARLIDNRSPSLRSARDHASFYAWPLCDTCYVEREFSLGYATPRTASERIREFQQTAPSGLWQSREEERVSSVRNPGLPRTRHNHRKRMPDMGWDGYHVASSDGEDTEGDESPGAVWLREHAGDVTKSPHRGEPHCWHCGAELPAYSGSGRPRRYCAPPRGKRESPCAVADRQQRRRDAEELKREATKVRERFTQRALRLNWIEDVPIEEEA